RRDRRPRPPERRGGRRVAPRAQRPAPRPRDPPRRAGGHVRVRTAPGRPERSRARRLRLPLVDPGAAGGGAHLGPGGGNWPFVVIPWISRVSSSSPFAASIVSVVGRRPVCQCRLGTP